MTFQEAIALQKATGNQNVITPENYGRIMGLAAQAEAGKQLAMDRGAQAVEERRRLQALQGDGSLASQGRLLETYDPEKGRQRFVFDKQGNVIGSATLDKPAAPVAGIDRELMNANRGLATDQEKQLLRQAMRDKMLAAVQGDKGMKAYDELQAEKAAAAQAQAESTGLKALTGGFSSIPFRQFQGSNFLDYIRDQSGAADALAKAEAAAAQSEAEATGMKTLTGGFSPVPFRQPQQGKDFLDYIRNQAKEKDADAAAAAAALAEYNAAAQTKANQVGMKALTGGFAPTPFRQPQQGKDFLDYIRGQAKDQAKYQAERDIAAEAELAKADAAALAQSEADAAAQANAEGIGLKALTGGLARPTRPSPLMLSPYTPSQSSGDLLSYISEQARRLPEPPSSYTPEQRIPFEKVLSDLENEFSVQGLSTPEQKEMGQQQANLYRRRNELLKRLQSGQLSTPALSPYYAAQSGAKEIPTPLSAAEKSKYIKELRNLEKKISELQKQTSGSQAKSATVSEELSMYRAIQDALDKMNP